MEDHAFSFFLLLAHEEKKKEKNDGKNKQKNNPPGTGVSPVVGFEPVKCSGEHYSALNGEPLPSRRPGHGENYINSDNISIVFG